MALIRCDRCGRRYRNQDDWNAVARQGRIVGYLCPDCQTPEENAEAEIKYATLDYHRDAEGRIRASRKTAIPELSEDEMQALIHSAQGGRSDVTFGVAISTDDDDTETGQVMFVWDVTGPVGYRQVGEYLVPPIVLDRLIGKFIEKWREQTG